MLKHLTIWSIGEQALFLEQLAGLLQKVTQHFW